ncbi:MAG: TPM domain-containing protein [Deltaproteobacteria bacterium]|nr:TPM domain-containing protein [Deltaproteobacteria bacterium]
MRYALWALLGFILILGGCEPVKTPQLQGPVNDLAEVIPESTRKQLETTLLGYERQTSNQVVILTVKSLNGETVEEYAHRVFTDWKLGQKDKDNGVLILLSTGDRKMRIEVGKGLEGALPDIVCGQIIRDQMGPNFKNGQYGPGFQAAVNSVESAIKGEFKVLASSQGAGGGATGSSLPWWGWVIIIIIVLIILIIIASNSDGRSSSGGYYSSASSSGGGSGGGYSGGGGSSGGGGASGSY